MAHEPLTTNEREQLVTAMVTNCSSFGEDDREWLDSLDDDRLTALAENCAEVKVLNERMAELEAEVATLNKKGAKNKGMPPWLKKKIDEKDEEDEEDSEEDMEENSGCAGKKKMAKNERADDDDEEPEDEDEQMTDDEWLERAPASVRNAAQRYQAWEDQVKAGLVKTITANTRFTAEFLTQKPLEELEILAEPFQKKGRQAAPAFAGMGAPTVRMTANAEPDMEEPLGIPEPDYAAYSGVGR